MSDQTKPSRSAYLQIVVRFREEARVVPLPGEGMISIGSAPGNTIVLADAAISEQHALLLFDATQVTIEQIGDRGDTFVARNGADATGAPPPLTLLARRQRLPLAVGDTLSLGGAVLSLEADATRATAPTLPPERAQPVVLDAAMVKAYELVTRAAATELPVLILGETGAGKDIIARTVHERSPRSHGPFTVLNCAALTESLIESELFGHEKGAFTGANVLKRGLLEASAGGTVFLDEIGELPLTTQAKLLRALEDRKILRVGAVQTHSVDVRFVSATNRDLLRRVREGKFRGDLYYRLSGVVVKVPPLRDRPAEIAPLARALASRFRAELGQPDLAFEPAALELLERHRWPGNVRELKNVVERAVILAGGSAIAAQHIQLDDDHDERPAATRASRAAQTPESAERARIIAALEQCGGNQTRAARVLGISRSALVHRLDRFRLPRPKKP
jgi:two-component system, NtrC family, response regulator AtoC